jgi:hypothetical protein
MDLLTRSKVHRLHPRAARRGVAIVMGAAIPIAIWFPGSHPARCARGRLVLAIIGFLDDRSGSQLPVEVPRADRCGRIRASQAAFAI